MVHFHIRWSSATVDWDAFKSEQEAMAAAEHLALPGETYAVEQFDGDCAQCSRLAKLAAAPGFGTGDRRT